MNELWIEKNIFIQDMMFERRIKKDKKDYKESDRLRRMIANQGFDIQDKDNKEKYIRKNDFGVYTVEPENDGWTVMHGSELL